MCANKNPIYYGIVGVLMCRDVVDGVKSAL